MGSIGKLSGIRSPAAGVVRTTSGSFGGPDGRLCAVPAAAGLLPAPGWRLAPTEGPPREGVIAGRAGTLRRGGAPGGCGAAGRAWTAEALGAMGRGAAGALGAGAAVGAPRVAPLAATAGAGAAGRVGGMTGAGAFIAGAGDEGAAGRPSRAGAPVPARGGDVVAVDCEAAVAAAGRAPTTVNSDADGNATVASTAPAAGAALSSPMGMTPPHTEHRARVPLRGTRAGSTRKTDRHSGQTTFTVRLRRWRNLIGAPPRDAPPRRPAVDLPCRPIR